MRKPKSLKDLLLVHELIFILLVVLAGSAGAIGIQLWDRSSRESERINLLVQEIQQTRGDLYRQMKELFDGYFLLDLQAAEEYKAYTRSVQAHFAELHRLATGAEEKAAISELQNSYRAFVEETSTLFDHKQNFSSERLEKALNSDLESGIFKRYELVSTRAEQLLNLKQTELRQRLHESKRVSILLLIIPMLLSVLLLLFSRVFLKRAIVRPLDSVLRATAEISTGRLEHKAPEAGVSELAILAQAINRMAEELARSQDALVRSEKQATQGLLVPMLAHNIRNPLASIRATAQVADSHELDAEMRESLQAIIDTVDRLERWTGGLLAYLHPLRPQSVNTRLRQIIHGALSPLQLKLREKAIMLELPDWEGQDDTLITDDQLLEQALYNLLLNAIEAAPRESLMEIHADLGADNISILIADRGPGMPFIPDPHTLSPGPSTKRFGTGLGIPFAFKVCEALGANIAFDARPGGGTLVRIELSRQAPVSSD